MMNVSDYIAIGLLTVLLMFKTTKYAAVCILIGYAVYFAVVVQLPDDYYYHGAALLNLIIGYKLFSKYTIVALLSFSLILVNNIGYTLFESGYDPALYDNLSLLIITIQILMLYVRAIVDGHILRGSRGRTLVCTAATDSFQSSVEVLQNEEGGER